MQSHVNGKNIPRLWYVVQESGADVKRCTGEICVCVFLILR